MNRANVSDVKAAVRQKGGEVTDVGYVQNGRKTDAFVEAYFDRTPPEFEDIGDNVEVDSLWDSLRNGVMFEVAL